MSKFTEREFLRYTRHIQLPHIGAGGQLALKNACVVVVGCGGLGAPVSLYLAAAGIGKLILVDGDNIDLTNLQRQVTFSENDIGENKALCTQHRLTTLNSDISVEAVDTHLDAKNAVELLQQADLVVDCTDNFAARYLINDTCKALKKPWIYASIFQFSGQCAVFIPEGPCFRCLFPSPGNETADCNSAGVLGVLPGMLGTIQATEAVKFLLKLEGSLVSQLLLVESLDMHMQTIALASDPLCPCCGTGQAVDTPNGAAFQKITSHESTQENQVSVFDFETLRLHDSSILIDVRSETEHHAFNLGGINIPLDQLDASNLINTTDKRILLYCQSGKRSQQACLQLTEKGIEATSIKGGLVAVLKLRNPQYQ